MIASVQLGVESYWEKVRGNFLHMTFIFWVLVMIEVAYVYIFARPHGMVYLRSVHFTLCKFYL